MLKNKIIYIIAPIIVCLVYVIMINFFKYERVTEKKSLTSLQPTVNSYRYIKEEIDENEKKINIYMSPILNYDGSNIDNSLQRIEDTDNLDYMYKNKNNDINIFLSDFIVNDEIKVENKNNKSNFKIKTNLLNSNSTNIIKYKTLFGINVDAVELNKFNEPNIYIYSTDFGVNIEREYKKNEKKEYILEIESDYLIESYSEYIIVKANDTEEIQAIIYAPFALVGNDFIRGEIGVEKRSDNSLYICTKMPNYVYEENKEFVTTCQSFYSYLPKSPDSTVYSANDNENIFLSQFIFDGYKSCNSKSETFVRFEILNDLNIEPEEIISAKYYINKLFKNLNGETNLYWVADDWCSSTVTWNTKAVFDKKKKIPGVELEDGKLEFDVTDIVKLWLKNKKHKGESFTIRTGLVLINDDKNSKQILLSNDNGLKRNLLEIQLMDK